MEEKANKGHNFEFKVINGKTTSIKMDGVELKGIGEITLSSYKLGDMKKDTITITFTDIESFKITNS
ncbi:hypothetical protein [Leptotrichia wadei]|uniref:hypothetical protein n=1 Tax=Leptotrichia wadei TaxID=157687 RepID=UPI0028D27DBC|nr:hypothetical protein [Leptotrichia wadei]